MWESNGLRELFTGKYTATPAKSITLLVGKIGSKYLHIVLHCSREELIMIFTFKMRCEDLLQLQTG